MAEAKTSVCRLRVTLREVTPVVWRRFEVTRFSSFYHLHLALQAVMGWEDSHLYEFRVGKTRIADLNILDEWIEPGDVVDVGVLLPDYLKRKGRTFLYEYDFGDSWLHELVLEEVGTAAPETRYPRCLDGAGACPPEDVGGPWGYARFLEALADPADPDHEMVSAWMPGGFDPTAFSVATVNDYLEQGYTRYGTQLISPLARLPRFTDAAMRRWAALPLAVQLDIVEHVWCAACGRTRKMLDFGGGIEKGDLILRGVCATCGSPVARVVA